VTLYAVGDIATCHSKGDEQTARLLSTTRGTIAALGDLVYPDGTETDFRTCFDPSWGPLAPRIRAALGNHEYRSGSAQAAIDKFHLPASGWYAYELGTWHVVVLNSNCDKVGCGRGSRQWRWLRSDLAAHPSRCTLAYWHHPRFSSGLHGSSVRMAALWNLLAQAHTEIVLSGHDHDYERFAPVDGIRPFVVGTGGAMRYPILFPRRGSVVHETGTFGVLRLRLGPDGYAWRFLPVGGGTFTDAGSGSCRL
jgi:calcineurin-like phosphoesterase family protein